MGGFEVGIENVIGRENLEVVFSSEIDKYASKSYKMYFDHKPNGDITKIDANDIPDHDILTAGFPCQAFSIAGNRGGFEDVRGTLFFDVVRVLKEKQPKVFIMENVKGLISHDKKNGKYASRINKKYTNTKSSKCIGKTLKIMEDVLLDLNYNIFWKILKTSDYNLPQTRERIYFVGFRKDLGVENFSYPKVKEKTIQFIDLLESNVDKNYYIDKEKLIKKMHEKDIDINKKIITNINPSGNGMNGNVYNSNYDAPTVTTNKGEGFKILIKPCEQRMDEGLRFFKDDNIGTLRTIDSRGDKRVLMFENNNWELRKITPKESWRLQGFPDEYHDLIAKEISPAQLYKQAGNAVSTKVVSVLYKEILKYLHKQ